MASLANGTYYVFNAAVPTRCLDVTHNSTTDGSNVWLYDYNQTDAQVWEVVDAGNGSRRIINRLSGKSLDVDNATEAVGTNVQIWTNTDPTFAGQLLAITDAETTATINGTSYDCFYLSMSANLYLVFAPESTDDEANISLATKVAGDDKQLWAFVPVTPFRDGGIYEIAPAINYGLRLDVTGAGVTDGTNLQLYAQNGTNAQKFVVTQESTGYSLQSVATGKFVDVDSALAADNTNVQMWSDNDTNAQRWNLVSYGTTVIDSETLDCYRLGSYVTNDGATYFMNVANAATTSTANVQIHTLTLTPNDCLFALIPSYAADPSIPVPYDLTTSARPQGQPSSVSAGRHVEQGTDFYLTWKFSNSWMSSGPNHYEIRIRTRSMSSETSKWGNWTNWSPWNTAGVSVEDDQAWLLTTFNYAYAWSQKKDMELQFQVRGATVDPNNPASQIVGAAATETIQIYRKPSITWGTAGITPAGIVLSWTDDYNFGSTEFNITGITTQYNSLLAEPIVFSAGPYQTSKTIDFADAQYWPTGNNITLSIKYKYGTDQTGAITLGTASVPASWSAGKTTINDPSLKWGSDGKRLVANVVNLGETRMWVRTSKRLFECSVANPVISPIYAGFKQFEILYPMGEAFELYTHTTKADGSQWATNKTTIQAINKYFHALTWTDDNGKEQTAYIDAWTSGGQPFQVTKNAVYQADILDDRPYESVSSLNAVKTRLTISGILLRDGTTDVEDVRFMVNHHARWRSPINGNYADLYISDVTLTEQKNRTEISISAIKETL